MHPAFLFFLILLNVCLDAYAERPKELGQSDVELASIDFPGHPEALAAGINDAGMIVGTAGDRNNRVTAFRGSVSEFSFFEVSEILQLSLPAARAVNQGGVVVGAASLLSNPAIHGIAWRGGTFLAFSYPGAVSRTEFLGINDAGLVVGFGEVSGGREGFLFDLGTTNAVRLDAFGSTFVTPQDINNLGEVVGSFRLPSGRTMGFKLAGTNSQETIEVPGSANNFPTAINDRGVIVGSFTKPGITGLWGFILRDGVFSEFNYPGAVQTRPFGINNSGVVVGYYSPDGINRYSFQGTLGAGPVLAVSQGQDTSCLIRWQTRSGVTYRVERRLQLGAGDWTQVGEAVEGTGEPVELSVEAGDSAGFFRVRGE